MNNSIRNNIFTKLKKEDNKINNISDLANSTLNSNTFDIKNYLNLYQNFKPKKSKNQKSFNIFNSASKYSTFNSKYQPVNYTSDGNITSTNYKTSSMDKNYNKGINIKKINIMSSTYAGNDKKKEVTFYDFPSTKSTSNFIHNRNKFAKNGNYSPSKTNESFNVFKVVKEIKKSLQFPKINNKNSQNKKIQIRNIYPSNTGSLPLAYKDKYISSVFDSVNVLNNYHNRKELELDIDNDLKAFPLKTKIVAIKNVLIDVINNESVKLTEKEKVLKIKNEKNQKVLLTELKEFNEFTEKQKKYCRNLEVFHENLQKRNEILIQEFVNYKVNKKNYTDETQKVLEQIESLRNYALFVHQALEKDTSRYEKNIFPDYLEEKIGEYDKNIEKVKNNVLSSYRIFWDKNYRDQLKAELKFLNNTDSMIFRFTELEGNIMRLLDELFNMNKEIEDEQKRNKENLDYLRERYEKAEEEYNIIEENLFIEKNNMNILARKGNELNSEYIILIGELFSCIVNVFGRFGKKNFNYNALLKEKNNKDNVNIFLKEGEKILRNMEDFLNSTLLDIKSFKENDSVFFNKFMANLKKKMKEEQIIQFKKNKVTNLIGKNNLIINKANKVPFIMRKTVVPYQSPKKKLKKVINHELIKKLEDEELIKFK